VTGLSVRFQLALLLSAAVHSLLLFGVSFKAPDWKKKADFNPPLEVVLVNARSATAPVLADALAQANLDGGGNTEANRRAKSPLPALDREQAKAEMARKAQQVRQMEQEARNLLTRIKAEHPVQSQPAAERQSNEGNVPDAADLMQKFREEARLAAQISRDWGNYQKRPKRVFLGARVREYRYARYVEDWRAKVEKVGNLNYPEAAKRDKVYGSLLLTVSIRADGEVENIEVNRSSGHPVLDEAAIRIVRLAAPYAPFPEDIRRDTDILSITRTWTFTRADQWVGE
jgi:protein TonB